jgi:hypothetical protein
LGGGGDDTLFGEGSFDFLVGGDGNDALHGGGDGDIVFGGAGSDELFGGDGNDHLESEEGNDTFRGGSGGDKIFGGDGSDRLLGEEGNDELYGEGHADVLLGQEGDDQLFGGADNDAVFGGLGQDVTDGGTGLNTVVADANPFPEDFNGDGDVDAADYVVYRKTAGSTIDLRADADGDGTVDQDDYQLWRAKFGSRFLPINSSESAAVARIEEDDASTEPQYSMAPWWSAQGALLKPPRPRGTEGRRHAFSPSLSDSVIPDYVYVRGDSVIDPLLLAKQRYRDSIEFDDDSSQSSRDIEARVPKAEIRLLDEAYAGIVESNVDSDCFDEAFAELVNSFSC